MLGSGMSVKRKTSGPPCAVMTIAFMEALAELELRDAREKVASSSRAVYSYGSPPR
jgi:hypothetical protein